jgi:hypothetical protein
MLSVSELALDHQRSRIDLDQTTSNQVLAIWNTANLAFLDESWDALAPHMTDTVWDAQVTAARQSIAYLDQMADVQDFDADKATLVPEAFGGIVLDGRELAPSMYSSVTTTKTLIGAGMGAAQAFQSGAAFLSTIVKSAVADMGRQSDSVLATGKGWTRYVRVVNPGACSRCAILAGKSDYKTAFKRHPACKCTSAPIEGDDAAPVPKGLFDSPDAYFDSLTKAEQDRIFTNAGAEAIRDGASAQSVVSARRGAPLRPGGIIPRESGLGAPLGYRADGSAIQVFATNEGTTARGAFGQSEIRRTNEYKKAATDRYRRTKTLRLMPETIYQMADGDHAKAVELLRKYGYLN